MHEKRDGSLERASFGPLHVRGHHRQQKTCRRSRERLLKATLMAKSLLRKETRETRSPLTTLLMPSRRDALVKYRLVFALPKKKALKIEIAFYPVCLSFWNQRFLNMLICLCQPRLFIQITIYSRNPTFSLLKDAKIAVKITFQGTDVVCVHVFDICGFFSSTAIAQKSLLEQLAGNGELCVRVCKQICVLNIFFFVCIFMSETEPRRRQCEHYKIFFGQFPRKICSREKFSDYAVGLKQKCQTSDEADFREN